MPFSILVSHFTKHVLAYVHVKSLSASVIAVGLEIFVILLQACSEIHTRVKGVML